ncbi:hypothetical protein ACE6H2_010395 [Prunus campanulata]
MAPAGMSEWMPSLHNLTRLALETNFFCEFLPYLGNFPSLEILEISRMLGVKKVGVELLDVQEQTSSFIPEIETTFFKDVQWEEWEGGAEHSEITIMQSLSSLTLWNSLKLKTLPDLLWKTPLKFLEITASCGTRRLTSQTLKLTISLYDKTEFRSSQTRNRVRTDDDDDRLCHSHPPLLAALVIKLTRHVYFVFPSGSFFIYDHQLSLFLSC